uniref:Uncharacterized protein n=1 Tax=Marmota marmota marmota TaxID=9994 RepID=A0A8C5ZRV0_MARMA
MEMWPPLGATCLLGFSFLLLITSSDGHIGLGKGFGDHIHWRTLEDGKRKAAHAFPYYCWRNSNLQALGGAIFVKSSMIFLYWG